VAGLLSKYALPTEQGVDMGTYHAVQGISAAIGPFTFGYIYNALENYGFWKTMAYNIAAAMAILAFPMVWYPLASSIKQRALIIQSFKENLANNKEGSKSNEQLNDKSFVEESKLTVNENNEDSGNLTSVLLMNRQTNII